ncbi:MAG: 2-succinyl-5-enolpyruvyl-6-hydroxy-3-cyclohexene-1-carboxylic-acid synthase [Planctomycetes bacterium]|nr:2-succinyl-5-enolpyruvyl-6-hydroxy-3-cyclohexene-1-carboxylic-acid synthase [Planctomycetota bacterium]
MSAAARNASLAASLVAALVRGGVREVVVSPGSRSAPLALAFAARTDVRVHVLVDERAAGFVALGLARATGDPVALLATSGTAGAHWYPAVIEAALSSVPLVLLTADRPPELQGCGAPQTIDQARLFGAHVRAFAAVGPATPEAPPGWAGAVAARLVDQAKGPPAGPVHLDVALREPLWAPGCEPPPATGVPVVRRARPRLPAEVAREALEHLAGERGVIVAGPRCAPPGGGALAPAVGALSDALGWPVVCDALSGLRHVRSADALLRDPAFRAEHRPTHALRLGQVPTSKVVQRWLADAAPRTVLVDPDGQWHDPEHQAALLLVADPVDACYALARSAGDRAKEEAWGASWAAADRAARAALDRAARDGWWEGAVARAVVDALPPGALLVVASSLAVRDVDAFGGAPAAALLSSRGANGIDGTIATAAGAALGWSAGPVVALVGDLAFVHDLGGLAAARELEVPLTVVVVDNGGGAIFGQLPVAAHPTAFERLFLAPSRLDLAAAARGLGAEAVTVHDLPALRAILARGGPGARVVRAPVERTEGARRREAAWAAVSRAWREPAEVLP